MDEKRTGAAWVGVVVLLLPMLYLGSYVVLAEAEPLSFMSGPGPWRKRVVYPIGGRFAEQLFAPANWADRRLRKRHWEWHAGDRLQQE